MGHAIRSSLNPALAIAAGLVMLAAGAATAGTPRAGALVPRIERLGQLPGVQVRDRVIAGSRSLAAARLAASHGGTYTTASGDQVKVFVSDAYPVDESVNQGWADFVAALLHGKEIAKVTMYVAPFSEMQTVCQSTEADGCYLFQSEQIVVPGEAPTDGVPVEEIVAHEYGHHIALNRSNWPWPAVEWGTKRWASYENVCARVLAHTAFPGDEGRTTSAIRERHSRRRIASSTTSALLSGAFSCRGAWTASRRTRPLWLWWRRTSENPGPART
jgi:hypothetical protein